MNPPVIGILTNEAPVYYENSMLGAALRARELGYEVVATDNWELLNPNRIAGLLYTQGRGTDLSILKRLEYNGLPIVASNIAFSEVTSVGPDNKAGIKMALQHLGSLGHKRIAYVRGPQGVTNAEERFRGYIEGLEELHLDYDPSLVVQGEFNFYTARQAVYDLLSNRRDLTAILCGNDRTAIGSICAIRQSGLKVPEDIAVIGFSNFRQIQCLTDEKVTSVHYPIYQIGIEAIDALHRKIQGKSTEPEDIRVPCHMVMRDSCGGSILKINPPSIELNQEGHQLNHLFHAGGDLDDEQVSELIEEFHSKAESDMHAVDALKDVFIKGIQQGLDPVVFHNLFMSVSVDFGYWSKSNQGKPTIGQVLNKLHERSRDAIMFYNRYSEDVKDRFASIVEGIFNLQVDAGGVDNVAEALRQTQSHFKAKHISLIVFDKPCLSLSNFNESVDIWQCDETLTLKRTRANIDINSTQFHELVPDSVSLKSITALDIKSHEGLLGMLFLDNDTEYSMEYYHLGSLVSAKLQRSLLYDSFAEQAKTLEQQTRALKDEKSKADKARESEEEARMQAEIANRAKSEFLTVMSHEIRTPLNCIMGMTDIALGSTLTTEQKEYLSIVKSSADTLLEIVNDLLDFSQIESGTLNLRYANFKLRDHINETLDSIRIKTDEKGIYLRSEIDDTIPDDLVGDPIRLRQVLINLIANGIKFTSEGGITVQVKTESQQEGSYNLRFDVSDTGIGISEEKRESIFQVLESANSENAQLYGGTGLSLTIISRLIKQMEGSIEVASEEGKGSSFSFALPFNRIQTNIDSISTANPATSHPRTRALVCSQTYDISTLVANEKSLSYIHFDSCDNVNACVDSWCNAFKKRNPYQIVILERRLITESDKRQLEETAYFNTSELAIIAPDNDQPNGEFTHRENHYYLKEPLEKHDLVKTLLALSENSKKKEPAAPAGQDTSEPEIVDTSAAYKILIVDDNAANQLVAQNMLEREGHTITKAYDGLQGIEIWRRGNFDLILMDVQMPIMDGWEATKTIRREEKANGGHTPIIALTSHAINGYDKKCYEIGMDGYITKPIERESFVAYVKSAPNRFGKQKQVSPQ